MQYMKMMDTVEEYTIKSKASPSVMIQALMKLKEAYALIIRNSQISLNDFMKELQIEEDD